MSEGTFEIVMFDLMKAIHVQLTDKTIHFIMTKVSGKYYLFEFGDIFDDKLSSIHRPINNLLKFVNLYRN